MSLSVSICGVPLRNRSVLASGILGVTLSSLRMVYNAGAGIVTTKSIGIHPRKGHSGPVIYDYGPGLINAVGLSNPGIKNFIEQYKNFKLDFPIIISVFGERIEDYPLLVDKLKEIHFDFIEINISCPNVEDEFGRPFSYSKENTYEITKQVRSITKKPIIVKLSPNTPELSDIALSAEKAGADCINVINTAGPGMIININTGYPVLSNLKGGISGTAILPLTIRSVYELYEKLSIPIIGTGGITNYDAAIQVIMAGASLYGIGTGIYTEGISIFNKINSDIIEFMESNKIKNLEEIVGISHRVKKGNVYGFYYNKKITPIKNKKLELRVKNPDFLISSIIDIVDDNVDNVRQIYLDFKHDNGPTPGQFYMIWVPGKDFKPYSVMYMKDEMIGFAVAKRGKFSSAIFEMKIGDALGFLGPLGKGFNLSKKRYLLIGGGIGLAPLIYTAETLLEMKKEVTMIFGAKTAKDILWYERYVKLKGSKNIKEMQVYFITEDGSTGKKGLITDYIQEISECVKPDLALVCGPEPFIKKSIDILISCGIKGEASIERVMKCGIGLCGSCSMDDDGTRVCKDGPVFSFDKISRIREFGRYKRDESGRIINI